MDRSMGGKNSKANGNAVDIDVNGEVRTMNVDSVMKERDEWDMEVMKRPPIGERDDDLEATQSIGKDKEEQKGDEKKEEKMREEEDIDKNMGHHIDNIEEKYNTQEEEKEEKKENKTEKKKQKKQNYIEPIEMKNLPRRKKIDEKNLKIKDYCIIQSENTRYLVMYYDKKEDILIGQYMLSHDREKEVEDRIYMRAWKDSYTEKIRIGGEKVNNKREKPYCIDFKLDDIYMTFSRLESRKIPTEIIERWKKEYDRELMCNMITTSMTLYLTDAEQKQRKVKQQDTPPQVVDRRRKKRKIEEIEEIDMR